MYFLSLCQEKSSFLFSFAPFSCADLEPLSEENAKSPIQLITQSFEYESLSQPKSLAYSWVCVCFSLFLPFPLYFLPPLLCLLSWFNLFFLLPPQDKFGYVKEVKKKKKSDIHEGVHHCLCTIFGGKRKGFRHRKWFCSRCSELKPLISGMEGSCPPE